MAEIRRDTFCCWQNCCNFHNRMHNIALRVLSMLLKGQIKAKFTYILLPQIEYDC